MPESELEDLHHRVRTTRRPDKAAVGDPSLSARLARVQDLIRYWGSDDWHEARGAAEHPATVVSPGVTGSIAGHTFEISFLDPGVEADVFTFGQEMSTMDRTSAQLGKPVLRRAPNGVPAAVGDGSEK